MGEHVRWRADRAPLFSSMRRRVGALMLLSALGAVGAVALWVELGVGYAALAYALTIGVLYLAVSRLVRRQSSGIDAAGACAVPPRPRSETLPLKR